jgi:hypothetical protein
LMAMRRSPVALYYSLKAAWVIRLNRLKSCRLEAVPRLLNGPIVTSTAEKKIQSRFQEILQKYFSWKWWQRDLMAEPSTGRISTTWQPTRVAIYRRNMLPQSLRFCYTERKSFERFDDEILQGL